MRTTLRLLLLIIATACATQPGRGAAGATAGGTGSAGATCTVTCAGVKCGAECPPEQTATCACVDDKPKCGCS